MQAAAARTARRRRAAAEALVVIEVEQVVAGEQMFAGQRKAGLGASGGARA